jgi:hypothetical protein
MIGLLVGGAALFSGDSAHPESARIFDIIDKPVSVPIWILEHIFRFSHESTIGWWLLFHFAYWMLLGGLVGWGIGIVRSEVIGDE